MYKVSSNMQHDKRQKNISQALQRRCWSGWILSSSDLTLPYILRPLCTFFGDPTPTCCMQIQTQQIPRIVTAAAAAAATTTTTTTTTTLLVIDHRRKLQSGLMLQ